ncbi:uncharacterized protein METZ01_LOCUS377959, partial [marine metagenome]
MLQAIGKSNGGQTEEAFQMCQPRSIGELQNLISGEGASPVRLGDCVSFQNSVVCVVCRDRETETHSSFSGFNKEDSIPVSSRDGGPSTFSRDHPR